MQKPKVLLVEDSPSLAEIYKQYLKSENINLHHASSVRDALLYLNNANPQLILLDLKLEDATGEKVLEFVTDNQLQSTVVVITAHGSVDVAVKLLRSGAHDFLQKPIDATRFLTTVRNCLENIRLKSLVTSLTDNIQRESYCGFVGHSPPMLAIYRIIESISSSDAAVFITGESGTGKEVCAEAIHSQSRRKKAPFIALNCGAIPKDLMESEIFGHQKGAFTGAQSDRKGAAAQADGGTLFLDEIGEMDIELQTKLLRFVQTGVIKKVGSSSDEKVDVRIICATNREPLTEIAEGRFRQDLYYRLNVLPLNLPPLRERGDDVDLLAKHFLQKYNEIEHKHFNGFSEKVLKLFRDYEWPGNVRQLQNIIRNVVVLNNVDVVELEHLPAPFNSSSGVEPAPKTTQSSLTSFSMSHSVNSQKTPAAATDGVIRPLALVEREAIEFAIDACQGNIPKAAAMLEVSPSTIYRKKQSWTN